MTERSAGDRRSPVRVGPWRIDPIVRDAVPLPLPISVSALGRSVAAALEAARAPEPASVGLVLSDDAELAELNEAHLRHEGPTDVLSFPLLPPEAFPPHPGAHGGALGSGSRRGANESGTDVRTAPPAFAGPPGQRVHIGDIVVSVERAAEQAAGGRGGQTGDVTWSAADELRLLVTHGTLHLCGWDHAEPVEEREMRALEQRLLSR
jgi:probable rRNA maturation factor